MMGEGNASMDGIRAQAQAAVRDLRRRKPQLDEASIDMILRVARSHYAWQ